MKWFGEKPKNNIVSATRVLVSAVGADEKLAAMADGDAGIYRKYYANVNYTPVGDVDSLVKIIKAGAFDLVLLGREQTVAWNPQGHTRLSQGAGPVSGFSVIMDGDFPYGPIFYREEGRRVNIYWERSGNPNYDIGFGYIGEK